MDHSFGLRSASQALDAGTVRIMSSTDGTTTEIVNNSPVPVSVGRFLDPVYVLCCYLRNPSASIIQRVADACEKYNVRIQCAYSASKGLLIHASIVRYSDAWADRISDTLSRRLVSFHSNGKPDFLSTTRLNVNYRRAHVFTEDELFTDLESMSQVREPARSIRTVIESRNGAKVRRTDPIKTGAFMFSSWPDMVDDLEMHAKREDIFLFAEDAYCSFVHAPKYHTLLRKVYRTFTTTGYRLVRMGIAGSSAVKVITSGYSRQSMIEAAGALAHAIG